MAEEEKKIPYKNLKEYLKQYRRNIVHLVDQQEDERITEAEIETELPQAFKCMHECLTKILIDHKVILSEEEKIGPRIEIIINTVI